MGLQSSLNGISLQGNIYSKCYLFTKPMVNIVGCIYVIQTACTTTPTHKIKLLGHDIKSFINRLVN